MLVALLVVPLARGQMYAFRHYGPEAGVPGTNTVAFDTAGGLYAGTNTGLLRFDGYAVAPVGLPGIEEASVLRVAAGPGGVVWVLVEGGHLFRMEGTAPAKRIALPEALAADLAQHRWFRRLRPDRQGRLWINDDERGLWCYDARTGRWAQRLVGTRIVDFYFGNEGALWLASRAWVGRAADPLHGGVTRVAEVPRIVFLRPNAAHEAWIGAHADGTAEPPHGVYLLEKSGALRPAPGLAKRFGAWLHAEPSVDAAGRLVLTGGYPGEQIGLYRLGPDGEGELSLYAANGWDEIPRQVLTDADGGLWIATDSGLLHMEQEHLVSYPLRAPDGTAEIPTHLARDAARDRLWISTWGGLYRLQGSQIERVSQLPRRPTGPVALLQDGRVWWAEHPGLPFTGGAGAARPAPRGEVVLAEHPGGIRYVTTPAGFYRVRGAQKTHLSGAPFSGRVALPDGGGRVWMMRWEEPGALDTVEGDSLGSACRACLPPSVRAVRAALRGAVLRDLRTDARGLVWAATNKGLFAIIPELDGTWQVRHFTTGDGLLSDDLTTVYPAADRRLWVGTGRGIQGFRVPPGELLLAPLYEFRLQDGLEGERPAALLEDERGYLWFGVANGKLHRLDYRNMPRLDSPVTHVARLERDGVHLPVSAAPVRLRAGESVLNVDLAAQTYRQLQRVRFQYRLAGRDTAWAELASGRTLVFGALPAGRYTLEARAVRAGSPPGPIVRQLLLATPPFYRTWWFPLGLALLVLAPLALWYRSYTEKRLAVEALRLRIATDLHDDLGSGLTQVSIYSELIRRSSEPQAAAWAEQVGEQARTLSAGMRDIVWAIHPRNESWEALELRMKDYAADLLGLAGIALDMHGARDGAPAALSVDVRRNVLLWFKEAIHNAARHSGCTRVEVRWRLSRRTLWLRVCDDGQGFDPQAARLGNGLNNLRHRATQIGAAFTLDAAPGRGTCVEIAVPLGAAKKLWRKTT